MNSIQGPPTHYPTAQESTLEVFRTRNFSLNEPYPPAYGAERAPPRYQEATEAEDEEHDSPEARSKARRTRYIRILASVLIITTVALIVAGVLGKIIRMQQMEKEEAEEERKAAEEAGTGKRVALRDIGEDKVVFYTHTTTALPSSTGEPVPSGTDIEGVVERDTGREEGQAFGASSLESRTLRKGCRPSEGSEYTILDCILASPSLKGHKDHQDHPCLEVGEHGRKLAEDPIVDGWEWDTG